MTKHSEDSYKELLPSSSFCNENGNRKPTFIKGIDKTMKKILALVLFTVVTLLSCISVTAAGTVTECPKIKLSINGKNCTFTDPPLIVNNRTLVPVREFLNYLGIEDWDIKWLADERKVYFQYQATRVLMQVDLKLIKVNDTTKNIDVAPILYKKNSRVYLPARYVCDALGKTVEWDAAKQLIIIKDAPEELPVPQPAQKIITVGTADEFVGAIASDTHIILKPGKYDLSSVNYNAALNESVQWEAVMDGKQLNISFIRNLTIEGSGEVEIVTSPRYAQIMQFTDSSYITLKNITAGHTPQEYMCDAGVVYFDSCYNVSIGSCCFYGCGSVGLTANNSKHFTVNDTVITECSLRAISLRNSSKIEFNNCKINKHKAYMEIIDIFYCSDIAFRNCEITDNNYFVSGFVTVESSPYVSFEKCTFKNNKEPGEQKKVTFFNISKYPILLRNCEITGNSSLFMVNNDIFVILDTCKIENNNFTGIHPSK